MNKAIIGFLILFGAIFVIGIGSNAAEDGFLAQGSDLQSERPKNYPAAYLAGGCFWCTESEYRALNGVLYTRVGYMGGKTDNPTYKDITTGKTGHAEIVEVTYDPSIISYKQLIEFFLKKAHDPTQLNRQGADVGTQYRSAIFFSDEHEKSIAKDIIDYVDMNRIYDKKIVTTLEPLSDFWLAEEYHQQYYEKYKEENGVHHLRVILKQPKRL